MYFPYPRTATESSCALSSNSIRGISKEKKREMGVIRHSGTLEQPRCNTVKVRGRTECDHAVSDLVSPQRDPDAHKHTCSHVQAIEHLCMQMHTHKHTHNQT